MATKAFLEKAYLAYFGRPVDPTGLTDYAASTDTQVADAFAASAESKALYGSTFNYAQINAIYLALFNREAEKAGLEYWYAKVADKTYTAAGAAIAILNGAQNADLTAIENKLAASAAFSAALDTSSEMIGYSGDAAAASARAFLSTVTTTAATAAAVDAAVASAVAAKTAVAGQTFTLTTGVDTLTGTAGNDSFGATATSLSILDNINGGAGTDSLTITDVSNTAYTMPTSTVTIAGIETIALAHSADAATDVIVVDVSELTAVRTLVVTNSSSAIGTNGAGGNDGATITTKGVTALTLNGGSGKAILDAAITDSGTNGATHADTLATITLEGIGDAADEAVAVATEALTTLNLKNVTALVTNTDTVTTDTRALTVNINGGTSFGATDAGATALTVNVTAATTDFGTITAAAATTVNYNVNAVATAGILTAALAVTFTVVAAAVVKIPAVATALTL